MRVFCCFSLGLLLFQSGSSVCPSLDGKIGNRVAEKFRFFRFMFNKFQPKDNSLQFFHHLLAMQLICDGQWWLAESSEWWNSAKMWKKQPLSHQKMKMLIFILRLTSDDWPSDPSNKSRLKCKKRPPKSSKNEMLSFGLCSTSDDRPSDWSDKIWLKCAKKGPRSHYKMKCLFLDYVQLLIIGWVIWAMKVNWNVTKGPLSHRTI